MWIRLLLMAVLAVLLLAATAPALEPPTFSNEVVRILQARCQTCHRPGEHAPFSLLTYRDAFEPEGRHPRRPQRARDAAVEAGPRLRRLSRSRAGSRTESSPPWCSGSRRGRPRAIRAKLPPPLRVPRRLEARTTRSRSSRCRRAYTVPARASDVYRCFVIPTSFAEDRWVTKVEYAPGDRKLVHHILGYIDTTAAAETLDRADPGPGVHVLRRPWLRAGAAGSPAGRRASSHA